MLGKYAVDVAGEGHVAPFLDGEWPFAAALKAPFTKLGKEPAKDGQTRPARGLKLTTLAKDPLPQTIFDSTSCGRFKHPLQSTDGAPAPCIKFLAALFARTS